MYKRLSVFYYFHFSPDKARRASRKNMAQLWEAWSVYSHWLSAPKSLN